MAGGTKRRNGPGKKTSGKTSVAMRPGPRGGMLQIGGTPGNRGGIGRPPSAIRERCRGSFDQRIPILEQIADGEAMQRIQVPLALVLRHAVCPKCGEGVKLADGVSGLLEIEGKATSSPRDRILAIGKMADVGMDAGRADAEDVRARLVATLTVIRAELPEDVALRLIGKLDPIWRAA